MASVNVSGQTWYWTSQADSSSSQTASQVAVDRNDNPFYTGYCTGTRIAFGNIGLSITGFQDDFLVKYNAAGAPLWARNARALVGMATVDGMSVSTDQNNAVVEVGYYNDSIAFGSFHLRSNGGNVNTYIVKYDASGNLLWATSATPTKSFNCENLAYCVATDKRNNILVAGYFMDTVIFGGNKLTAVGTDMYLVKYSPAGNVIWARTATLARGAAAYAFSIATDDSCNAYISGNIIGTVAFGSTPPLAASENVYLAKYDSAGNAKWSLNTTATPGQLLPTPVEVDKSNNVYLGAQFTNAFINFGASTVTNPASSLSCSNALLAKYTPNGIPIWATCADFISNAEVCVIVESAVATDRCNNVYWSGLCSDSFGVGPVKVTIAGGASNQSRPFAYVIKLDSNGAPLAGAALANQNANSFSNYLAVDSLSKALFVSELVNPATLVVGSDTVKRYLTSSTCFISKFAVLPPILSANGSNDTICSGDSVVLRVAPVPGINFTWSTGSTADSIVVKPHITTTYFVAMNNNCEIDTSFIKVTVIPVNVSITGIDTICKGDTDILTGRGGMKYLWSNGKTTSIIKVAPVADTTYTLTVSNGTCSKDTTFTIVVLPPSGISITASPSTSICIGDSVILTAHGGTSYLWSTGSTASSIWVKPGISTKYILHAPGARCPDSTTINIIVAQIITAIIRAVPDTVCQNSNSTIIATAIGGPARYRWNTGATASSINVSVPFTTKYIATVYGICDSVTDSVTVVVIPAPKPVFGVDVQSGCAPLCVQFVSLNLPFIKTSQWAWNFGNGDSALIQTPIYCYKDTGVFSVSLTETFDGGCSTTLKIVDMIKVFPPPIANFTYAPQSINILNPLVQFTNLSKGVYPINQWYWTFRDKDSTSTQINPEHTYSDTGTFCPTLTVIDSHGCIDSVTNCFVVNPLFTFYIPSAFSPNGDGMNDVFMPKGTYVKDFNMYIFDRWGMEFFHSTDMNNGWNGTVNGGSVIAQEDIYVYLIHITDSQGNAYSYTGNITLLK